MHFFRVSLCSILFVALSFLKATAAGSYAVWATGANFSGQLGDGTTTSRSTPAPVASGVATSRGELFFIDAGIADPGAFRLAAPKGGTVVCIPAGVDSWRFMSQEAARFQGLSASKCCLNH